MDAEVVARLGWQDLLVVSLVGGLAVAIFTKIADGILAAFQRRSQQSHEVAAREADLAHRRTDLAQQADMQQLELDQRRQLQGLDQAHQRQLQLDSRAHGALERLRDSHDAARDALVADVASVEAWLQYHWGVDYGLERGDWVAEYEPKPRLQSIAELLAVLDGVAAKHPLASVRSSARALRGSISGHFGSIQEVWDDASNTHIHQTGTTPAFEQYQEWADRVEELIRLMHTPPTAPDVPVDGGASQSSA